ncbi:hypothetical protein IFM89_000403, partial [Coptis chinensis]
MISSTEVAGGIWADTVGGKFVLGFAVIWWSIATALMPIAAKLVLPFLLVVRAFMGIESRRGQPNESRESESSKSVGWNTIKSSSESPRTGNFRLYLMVVSFGQSSHATSLSLSTIDDNVSKPQAELDHGDKDTEESSKHGDNNTHV